MITQSTLPPWKRLLVVIAHPDDESFGLGAVLSNFVDAGAQVSVLCLTRGEASTLREVPGDLAAIRGDELAAAAHELGIDDVVIGDFPDGGLADVDPSKLDAAATALVARCRPEGILAFDLSGVTGHPDHIQATALAQRIAQREGVGLLGWTLPDAVATTVNAEFDASLAGRVPSEIDVRLDVDRERQRRAVACHPSQLTPGALLWRRLELLGDEEHLCWLHRADDAAHG
jgi:N-acetylglucosamine malate deacetylase 2